MLSFVIVLYSVVLFAIFSFTIYTTDSNSVFILFTHLGLDECASPNECDLNALCTNTEGSSVCHVEKVLRVIVLYN